MGDKHPMKTTNLKVVSSISLYFIKKKHENWFLFHLKSYSYSRDIQYSVFPSLTQFPDLKGHMKLK